MRTLRETSGVDEWIPIEPAGVGEGYDAPYLLRYELELRRMAAQLKDFESFT
jgi:hypothetical protein